MKTKTVEEPTTEKEPEVVVIPPEKAETIPAKGEKKSDNKIIWITVIILVIVIAIFMYMNYTKLIKDEDNGSNR